jgi:hypothetical protein
MKMASLKTIAGFLISGYLLLIVVSFPILGIAQEPPKQETNIGDAQLRSFAEVYVQVEKIRQLYEPRLKEAQSPDEGKQIQNEAQSKMQQTLTKEGLTEQDYNQIFEVARVLTTGCAKKSLT